MAARPPVLMKMRSASSSVPSTRRLRGLSKRAWPRWIVTFAIPSSQRRTPSREARATSSFRAFTRAMSTATPSPSITP